LARYSDGLLGAILLMAGTGWSLGFSGESPSGVRREAVSQHAFETILPVLQELKPDDSLLSIEAHLKVYREQPDTGRVPIVVIPGWISSLSGGAIGGVNLIGGVTGRSGDRIFGTHVFGYVRQEMIVVPRFLVLTEATVIGETEYSRLRAERTKGAGVAVEPGGHGMLCFRDLHIRETRALSFVDELEDASVTLKPAEAGEVLEWFFSERSFQEIEQKLRSLAPGTSFWDVLAGLGTRITTGDFGHNHTLQIRGYVSSDRFPTQFLTRETGVYSIWPFGYVKKKRERPQLVLVFKNNQLLCVSPFTGNWNISDYVVE